MTPENQGQEIKKYVLTVLPDVCKDNGKDPEATELLRKMETYGKVEPLQKVIDAVMVEYQESLGNALRQLEAIQELALTEDEIVLLNVYRNLKSDLDKEHQARISALEQLIKDIGEKYKRRLAQISALIDEDTELATGNSTVK